MITTYYSTVLFGTLQFFIWVSDVTRINIDIQILPNGLFSKCELDLSFYKMCKNPKEGFAVILA